jgi:hypothetical protein
MGKPIAFNGTGLRWHPTLDIVMGTENKPGVYFDLKLTEVRLYQFINWECGKIRERTVELSNRNVMMFTKLNKNSLPKARRHLVNRKLIAVTKLGKGEIYRYEIVDPQNGWTLASNRYSPKLGKQDAEEEDKDDSLVDSWGSFQSH